MAKKKRRGHWCWSCDRVLPNERFSGAGHARHLCRDCSRLGAEELAYRQAERDLCRTTTWDGLIRRKERERVNRFLEHQDPRVRKLAADMLAADAEMREAERKEREAAEQAEGEAFLEKWGPDTPPWGYEEE